MLGTIRVRPGHLLLSLSYVGVSRVSRLVDCRTVACLARRNPIPLPIAGNLSDNHTRACMICGRKRVKRIDVTHILRWLCSCGLTW